MKTFKNIPERPVGVAGEDGKVVVGNAGGNGSGSGIGYIGSQHSRSGNSLHKLMFTT